MTEIMVRLSRVERDIFSSNITCDLDPQTDVCEQKPVIVMFGTP